MKNSVLHNWFVTATLLHINIQIWIKSKNMAEKKGVYRILVRKPEEKRPLGRPRSRWEDNIKILRKWDLGVWTGLSWLRIGTGVVHL